MNTFYSDDEQYHDSFVSRSELRDDGWADASIRMLGEPDEYGDDESGDLWLAYKVAELEDPDYGSRDQRHSRKDQNTAKRRAGTVVRKVRRDASGLEVVPPATLRELDYLVLSSHNVPLSEHASWTRRDAPAFIVKRLDRWRRNYLRHSCTEYDAVLARTYKHFDGYPGLASAYHAEIRPAVDEKVEAALTLLIKQSQQSAVSVMLPPVAPMPSGLKTELSKSLQTHTRASASVE